MRARALSLAVVALSFAISCGPPSRADDWRIYQNDRYGTTIEYPSTFRPQPPPDADDGRAFKSADGGEFSVFASYGGIDSDLAQYRDSVVKNLDAGSVVTYQTHGGNWFVVSGTKGDKIFYERHLLSHRGEMTEGFVITYPASLKQTYDPIVARMAKSFRSGSGFQTQ
jgi:serine/threonine-protein kinase